MSIDITDRDHMERIGSWSLVRRSLGIDAFGVNLVEIAPGTAIEVGTPDAESSPRTSISRSVDPFSTRPESSSFSLSAVADPIWNRRRRWR